MLSNDKKQKVEAEVIDDIKSALRKMISLKDLGDAAIDESDITKLELVLSKLCAETGISYGI